MSKHSLVHAVKIKADRLKVQDALTTAKGLESWTAAKVSGGAQAGGKWSFKHLDGPSFIWEIQQSNADTVSWKCVEGPGDSAGTTATFHISNEPDGRIHVSLEHAGWSHQEGNFAKCNSLWGAMLHRLREHAEGKQHASVSH
jgi:uncharacterized protein YndB with AHSA1/START domain